MILLYSQFLLILMYFFMLIAKMRSEFILKTMFFVTNIHVKKIMVRSKKFDFDFAKEFMRF